MLSDEPLPRVRFPDFVRETFGAHSGHKPGTWEAPSHTWVAPVAWSVEAIAPRVHAAIFDRMLRPHDIEQASHVDPPTLAWIPIWRVELSIHGTLFYIFGETTNDDPNSVIRRVENGTTTGGIGKKRFDDTRAWWAIPARRQFPLPGWIIFSDEVQNDPDQHRAWFELSDAVPLPEAKDVLGPAPLILEGDVAEHEARSWARSRVDAHISNHHATQLTLKRPELKVLGAHHCLWPVYFVPYSYVGKAAPAKRAKPYFVALSARTGKVVHHDHPSSARAVLSRVASLLAFDRSALR